MLRIIDANLNRIGEGLRLLEDVARFILDDAQLSEELKRMRHTLAGGDPSLKSKLLSARNSEGDVGAFFEVPGEAQRQNLVDIVIANARRVEESLRVVEELSKLPQLTLNTARFKQARFAIYGVEKRLVGRLLRHDKVERITGLYVVIDPETLGGRSEVEVARQAIRGGARVIQLRDKRREKGKMFSIAQELKRVCAEGDALFIINDHLDLALACDADGIHLGQKDLPLPRVREILPIEKIIGLSTATIAEAQKAEAEGADYISIGAIYPTLSKGDARWAGLETLREVKGKVSLPIVAIGGINKENIAEVVRAGANSVAVISAIAEAEDIEMAARELTGKIDEEINHKSPINR